MEDKVKKICNDYAGAIVGRLYKIHDVLKNNNTLTDEQRFSLIKDLHKECVYEELRNIAYTISSSLKGYKVNKYKTYHPNT